jgi:hypothetical protein
MTSEGTRGSTRFDDYLLELGRATWAASVLAMYAFDLLRVFGGVHEETMDSDAMGTLVNRLRGLMKRHPDWPELAAFVEDLDEARVTRNDLLHALPVHDGLYRRRYGPNGYIRNFFTVESLAEVTASFTALERRANALLYKDGGAAVDAWYGR